ncbi:glycosyltransferase family 2 protein [Sulfitobacter sabulilitoris]|uniref:Glycosyltransferase family 2 protein n=1 Tax=Sulfitobacter sabulilitoris TaxID=2562655 RepID=A0A5S3P7Q2_9RHOB|nr:glycosyltransferase family 2 protein [Sulfitobacter sabulilitoris]TMM49317.1 glycosyltransferase family 2 protein [Sulfitobacter sabulilitoris]
MATDPSLLCVVLNYKTPQMTLRAAEAALSDMAGLRAEMVIVDNASGDGSADILRDAVVARGWDKTAGVRVIASARNGGFGAGNNIGIRAGLGNGDAPDYVYIVNSDAFADRGCIAALLDHLQSHPEAGFAGSAVRGEDDAPHRTAFRFPSITGEIEAAARTGLLSRLFSRSIVAMPIPKKARRVDWVAGASVMMRGDMLCEIGLFDETFFLYFEETDLCLRGARAGWQTWYVPQSRIVHIGSVSTGMKTWTRMPGYWFGSRWHYFTKNHGRLYAAAATLAHLSGGAVYRLRRLLQGKPQRDPDRFLRDLMRHDIRAMTRRHPCVPPPKPQPEASQP